MQPDFIHALDTLYETGDVDADVGAFERRGGDAVLTIRLYEHSQQDAVQTWSVECESVRAYSIQPGRTDADHISIHTEAPELWTYTEAQASLFCSGVPAGAADAALGAMYRAYAETVGEASASMPFADGLNALASLYGRHGVVYNGPLPLARAYAEALEAVGVETSIVTSPETPTVWNGSAHVERTSGPLLLVCGDSYVIAEAFSASRSD